MEQCSWQQHHCWGGFRCKPCTAPGSASPYSASCPRAWLLPYRQALLYHIALHPFMF